MTAPPADLLTATGLRRSYPLPRRTPLRPAGRRAALAGVDLILAQGDRLGIVGESGAGKSTLLRLLLGLDRPDAGTVRFRGREVRAGGLRWFRREVQPVFQDPHSSLDPRLTVRDIIAEPLECLGIPGDHDLRVAEVLADVDLDPAVAGRHPHQFSGGQRQRIAIARALAPRPSVLVGDEPFSALDASVRGRVVALVGELATRLHLSLILVSHDIGVVHQLCDQLLVLSAGAVVERGPTATVLRQPRHPYTTALLRAVPRLPAPAQP